MRNLFAEISISFPHSAHPIETFRLVALITPPLLGLVFTVCSVIRLIQKAPTTYRNYDLSCSSTLLLILMVQLVEKFGFFIELLSANFHFEITMGNAENNQVLHAILKKYFQVGFGCF